MRGQCIQTCINRALRVNTAGGLYYSEPMSSQTTSRRSYVNWFLLSLFFAYQYLLRGYPGIFTSEIRGTFRVDATRYSDLGAWCMFAYSLLQIPFGMLLDRIGVRRVVLTAFALCLLGQYTFTHAQTFETALCGRLLLGIGATPGYMSALKLVVDSFTEKSCGLFIGLTGAFGNISLALCEPRLKAVGLAHDDWRFPALYLNVAGILIFIACVFLLRPEKLVPNKTSFAEPSMKNGFWKNVIGVALNYKVYLYALLIIGTNILAAILVDLWGKSFLNAKYHLSEQEAINTVQWIQIGRLAANIILPLMFAETRLLRGIRISCASLVFIFSFLIYGPQILSENILRFLLFGVGFFGNADVLIFTLGAKLSTPQTSGMIISWINSVSMFGEPVLQKWIGVALDKHWSGLSDADGLRIYRAFDYECAMSVMLKVVCVCFVIACLMRNKKQTA